MIFYTIVCVCVQFVSCRGATINSLHVHITRLCVCAADVCCSVCVAPYVLHSNQTTEKIGHIFMYANTGLGEVAKMKVCVCMCV